MPKRTHIKSPRRDLVAAICEDAVARQGYLAKTSNIYLLDEVRGRRDSLDAITTKIRLRQESVVLFADDLPGANWAHPCRYLVYSADSGALVEEIRAQFPPFLREPAPASWRPIHLPVPLPLPVKWPVKRPIFCPVRRPAGRRYAVLYSGLSNNRHVNDLEFLYRTLIDRYAYSPDDIIVLNYDGTRQSSDGLPAAWPGDNTAYTLPVHGAGTQAALENAFSQIGARLKSGDSLLLHTNNHGYHDGTESQICAWQGSDVSESDLSAMLQALPAFHCLMVMMEQCNSGGFNAPVVAASTATNTSIAVAADWDKSSWGDANFDFFAEDWISAMNGATPSGGALASAPDVNGDGRVSAQEAYDYAFANKYASDTPSFSSSGDGALCSLSQRWVWLLRVCPRLVRELIPVWRKLPPREYAQFLQSEVVPRLEELEAKLEQEHRAIDEAIWERSRPVVDALSRFR